MNANVAAQLSSLQRHSLASRLTPHLHQMTSSADIYTCQWLLKIAAIQKFCQINEAWLPDTHKHVQTRLDVPSGLPGVTCHDKHQTAV